MFDIIVNKENIITSDYLDSLELVDVNNVFCESIKIEKNTYDAYLKLEKFLRNKNIYIGLDSAFRSLEDQEKIYDEFVNKYGLDYANTYVAPIGTSEHHTGLAIDLTLKINNIWIDNNDDLFFNEDIFKIIHENLYKFGFILRYPKNCKSITGYDYEPWHIRYVGKDIAKYMKDNNIPTFEEYKMTKLKV